MSDLASIVACVARCDLPQAFDERGLDSARHPSACSGTSHTFFPAPLMSAQGHVAVVGRADVFEQLRARPGLHRHEVVEG